MLYVLHTAIQYVVAVHKSLSPHIVQLTFIKVASQKPYNSYLTCIS